MHLLNFTYRERNEVQCNWIEDEQQGPQYYCNLACIPIVGGTNGLGYWQKEWIRPATQRNDTCEIRLPANKTFWGYYNLTCEKSTKPLNLKRQRMPAAMPRVGEEIVKEVDPNRADQGSFPATLVVGADHEGIAKAREIRNQEIFRKCGESNSTHETGMRLEFGA